MPTVHLRACTDYSSDGVEAAVRGLLQALPSIQATRPGARVLLKPNVINPLPPERACCTHPQVVRAVAQFGCEAGWRVLVADEPGYALTGSPDQIFEATGMAAALEGLPLEVDLLKRGGYRKVTVPHPLRTREVSIATRALDADLIINLPKCKTHQQTLYTGAIKNMFGAVAPKERIALHTLGTFAAVSECLADCFSACVPHVSLMDAVVGMEGKGPSHGSPRPIGFLAASEDSVALDAVVADTVGFRVADLRTITAAADKGLGCADLTGIAVEGPDREKFRCVLKHPPGGIRRGFPRWVGRLIRNAIWVRPLVEADTCVRCSACAGICPGRAIHLGPHAIIDYTRCIECFCCQEVCPVGAIDTRRSWLASKVIGHGPRNR
jgi:uncharacterized protein (DUF362 family)/Pyruvate/2-oxoacid:ferredoxin oxidoreductase delta subunit